MAKKVKSNHIVKNLTQAVKVILGKKPAKKKKRNPIDTGVFPYIFENWTGEPLNEA